MNNEAYLLYGGPGVGKTYTACTSFWDNIQKKQTHSGRLLYVGREDNASLTLPDDVVRGFVSPYEQPDKFLEDLKKYLRLLVKDKGLEYLVIDGFTEISALFTLGNTDDANRMQFWGK